MTLDRRRFHLEKRLGAGAFGEVYLAELDSGAGFRRRVALKLLHPHHSEMEEAGRRMRDEARILGRLSHRHIVSVLDLVRVDDRWAVVMDYVAGPDLDRMVSALETAGEPFPPPAALEVGAAILSALHAAFHADDGRGNQLELVHRDIKPSNVLLTADGDVKVLDFGIAHVNLETRESATRDMQMGTERYMAPERLLSEGDSSAGDVYATAATIVELILGKPFGRTPILEERHAKRVTERMEEVRPFLAGPPETVDAVIEQLTVGLHADPAQRPSAEALGVALSQLARTLQGEPLQVFARRFVPQCDAVLGELGEVVSGVLSETPTILSLPNVDGVLPTDEILYDDPEDLSPGQTRSPSAKKRSRKPLLAMIAGVAIGLFGLSAVAGIAIIGGVLLIPTGQVTESPDPDPPRPEPSTPEPVVQPDPGTADTEAPAPNPGEVPQPQPIEPAPSAQPEPANPQPQTTPKPPPKPADDAPRVAMAKFTVKDASSVRVTCGDVSSAGTSSVMLRKFPAGSCRIQANYLGNNLVGSIEITGKKGVICTPSNNALQCQ